MEKYICAYKSRRKRLTKGKIRFTQPCFSSGKFIAAYKELDMFEQSTQIVREPDSIIESRAEIDKSLEDRILNELDGTALTAKELLIKLNLDWSTQKLNKILRKIPQVEVVKTNKSNQFKLRQNFIQIQRTLFELGNLRGLFFKPRRFIPYITLSFPPSTGI